MASSIGSRDSVSFLRSIQATGRRTFTLVGLTPTEYASLRWTHPHALRIPPRDGHPALRELQSGGSRSALVCLQLSPSCPFRPLHTFHSSRPTRNYPRFWIWHPSFERQRDFNPPEQDAL